MLEVGTFLVRTLCHCRGGGAIPHDFFKKSSCPEIGSGGFWQLADYSILGFKITYSILTL